MDVSLILENVRISPERQKGYQARIRNLEELLPLAKMTDDIVNDAAGYMKQKWNV